MGPRGDLSGFSCWVVTEDLIGLQNQAIGLAQALGLKFTVKKIKKKNFWDIFASPLEGLSPPWPRVLISCGRQSVAASVFVRRLSGQKTFTVHIQNPLIDPKNFDVVVAPAHDHVSGPNVVVTQGAVHKITPEQLKKAAVHFQPLFNKLPRPLISVLVGGKNKHQAFTPKIAQVFAAQLAQAVERSNGALAVSFSRRTGQANEALLRKAFEKLPSYIWDGKAQNPYFALLGLGDAIVVTSDSLSMVSEACSTGKPVYIYELPRAGRRHQEFVAGLYAQGVARPFAGRIDVWNNTRLDETRKAADFVRASFARKALEGQTLCKR